MSDKNQNIGLPEIFGFLAGLLFLFSGVTKALDATLFAQTIASYGFPALQFLSPVIIVAEVLLALCLMFGVYHRWSALVGAVMILVFSLFYTYAFLIHGITDCGCFGGLKALNQSPLFLYSKNTVLFLLLVCLFLKGENHKPLYTWLYTTMLLAVGCISFLAGKTYRVPTKDAPLPEPIAVADSPLASFVNLSNDSTYIIFAFSYTCPHCMNSIANLNQYEQLGVADRVIGLAMGNAADSALFVKETAPEFQISSWGEELFKVTSIFPTTFYVRNDSILLTYSGELPAAYFFKKYNEEAMPADIASSFLNILPNSTY